MRLLGSRGIELAGRSEESVNPLPIIRIFLFEEKFGPVTHHVFLFPPETWNSTPNFPPRAFNVLCMCAGVGVYEIFGMVNAFVYEAFRGKAVVRSPAV